MRRKLRKRDRQFISPFTLALSNPAKVKWPRLPGVEPGPLGDPLGIISSSNRTATERELYRVIRRVRKLLGEKGNAATLN